MIEPVLGSPWVYYTTKPGNEDWYETSDSGGEKQKLYYHDGRWYINESCTEKYPYHISYWKDNTGNQEIDRKTQESILLMKYFTKGYLHCIEEITKWNGSFDESIGRAPLHSDLLNKLNRMENLLSERVSNMLKN